MAEISEDRSKMNYVRVILEGYGGFITSAIDFVGSVALLTIRAFKGLFIHKFEFRELIHQFFEIGNKSLFLVGLIAIFTGLSWHYNFPLASVDSDLNCMLVKLWVWQFFASWVLCSPRLW